ncbi:hypothetical protein Tco_1510215 [Tanacetum coccineum]
MLETTCSELHYEVSGYKLFKEQIEAAYDEKVKVLSDRIAELDSELMGMALYLDEEFYPRYLTTIAGRRWVLCRDFKIAVMKCLQSLKYLVAMGEAIGHAIENGMQDGMAAGIEHEKSERGLVDVAAYNPSAEANYISVVNALRAVDFNLLAQLESYKDASIADILDLLHLEGPAAKTPKASQLQPSSEQLMLPIYLLEDQVLSISDALVPLIEPLSVENLVGEASTFRVPAMITTTALSTTFTGSTPSVSVVDYEVSGARPSTEVSSPPKIMFEKEELETTPEHTMVD